MAKRKIEDQIFQCPFFAEQLSPLLPMGEGQFENLTPNYSFHHNFWLVVSNQVCKTILYIYISTNLSFGQCFPLELSYQMFAKLFPWGSCSKLLLGELNPFVPWEVAPLVNLVPFFPREIAPLGNFSLFLPEGTWWGLPFCLLFGESPFILRTFSLNKLRRGFFLIHFIHGRTKLF
jgi:hypothetical protein